MKKALLKVLVLCIIICSAFCVFTACTESSISFKVNFVVDEEIVKTIDTAGNEKISLPENPKKDGFDFDGWFWDKDVWEKPFTANSLLDAPLSSDMSVYAKFTKKHEHNYIAVITAPTCTERGYTTYTCECGDSYIGDYIDELGHDFGAWIETTAPTCTTKGVETRYCSRDNTHFETRERNALGHTPETAVEENRQEPKCEVKGGYDLVVYCKTCGAELSREHKEIAALTHEFTNYVSDNNATYDSDGTKTAYCNHGCGEKYTVTDVGTKLQSGIAFKTLAVDGNNVYGKIPNTQTEFDFLTEIEKKGNVTYDVSRNLAGDDIIVSKTAEPSEGDNKYYILVYQNNELLSRYNVIIRRREIYDVTFNTDGGTTVAPQRIEEDNFATKPTTARAGYNFIGWDYDFNKPITGKTTINALWNYFTLTTDRNDTGAGTVSSYNQTKITVGENVTITATTNAGYTFIGWYNGETKLGANLSYTFDMPDENIAYTAKWCKVTLAVNDTNAGMVTELNGKYLAGEEITVTATTNNGYTWLGWYNDEEEITKELSYTFDMPSENITYTAKWAHYTLTTDRNDAGAGLVNYLSATKITVGENVTVTAITNNGYAWIGWYNGEEEITKELSYSFYMPSKNVTYTAKWVNSPVTLVKNIEEAGTVYITDNQIVGKSATITATTNAGYTWLGWYNGEEQLTQDLSYTFDIPREDVDYTAKWIYYTLTTSVNYTSAGTVTAYNETKITVGESITIIASTKAGYAFIGWYNGEEQLTQDLSYTFNMPDENINYTAKWCQVRITRNITKAGTVAGLNGKYLVGESATVTAITNTGYTWVGWYNDDEELTKDLSYTFVISSENVCYTAKWTYYTLTTSVNDTSAGTVTAYNETKITVGESITITASTKAGYTFVGWYNGEQELTKDLSYTFKMPDENIVYTAKWCKVTIVVNNRNAGSIPTLAGKYFVGESVTITAGVNLGYTFVGWYNGEEKLTKELNYTFDMPSENVVYTAKWEIATEMSNFNFTSTTTSCTITGIKDKTVTEIIIPDYVTTINQGALSGCSELTSLTIPFIGGSKFAQSANGSTLFGYVFGRDNYAGGTSTEQCCGNGSQDSWIYYIPTTLKTLTVTGGKMLYGAFWGCGSLTNVYIGNSVTNIGQNAFYLCTALKSVTIGDSVTSISNCAFYYCTSLTVVTIDCNVTRIGHDAFTSCNRLTQVNFLGTIDDWAQINFDGPSANPLHSAHNLYINNELVTQATITLATNIGNFAFYGCSSLTSAFIGNSVTSIGCDAFDNCTGLTEVAFENTSGWQVSTSSTATSGTLVNVEDTFQNVTYLKTTYSYYYWKRG